MKYHLVDWKTVCQPIKARGLGIRKFKMYNQSFLGKWLWGFGDTRDNLLRKVIVAKYGCNSVWDTRDVRGSHGFGLWKSILNGKEWFDRFIKF